jgi:hypothetical protein
MARKGVHEEEQYDYIILDLLPYELPGVKYQPLWNGARREGISSKDTFGRHLRKLISVGFVLHEGLFYRRNPLHSLRFERAVSGKYRRTGTGTKQESLFPDEDRVRPSLTWQIDAAKRDRHLDFLLSSHYPHVGYGSIKNVKDMLVWVEPTLSLMIVWYLRALRELVKIENKEAAREYLELAIKMIMRPPLMLIGYDVWRKRHNINFLDLFGVDQKEVFPQGLHIGKHPSSRGVPFDMWIVNFSELAWEKPEWKDNLRRNVERELRQSHVPKAIRRLGPFPFSRHD